MEINGQIPSLRDQQDRILDLRWMDVIDKTSFAAKNTVLRNRIAEMSL